jgi:hypothetical protein
MREINLYGETDGITVIVDHTTGEISGLEEAPEWDLTKLIGHRAYACGLGEARRYIIADAAARGLIPQR